MRRVFKRIGRMRGKNLCVHGEDAKRLLAYSPNTPKDIKVCISRLIIIQMINFSGFFLSTLYGMVWAKKPSHATVSFKQHYLHENSISKCHITDILFFAWYDRHIYWLNICGSYLNVYLLNIGKLKKTQNCWTVSTVKGKHCMYINRCWYSAHKI